MTTGHDNPALGVQVMCRKVKNRGRHTTNVFHITARFSNTLYQGLGQHGTRKAAIAPHNDRIASALQGLAANGVANQFNNASRERFINHATNVIGPEY